VARQGKIQSEHPQLLKYWEIIAENLSKAGWSWGCVSAVERSLLLTRIVAQPALQKVISPLFKILSVLLL